MIASQKRSLKSRQIGVVQTYHLISGTAGTPADSGLDAMYVSAVTDLGTGNWKLTFKDSSRLNIAVLGLIPVTADRVLSIQAVDQSSVTILSHNLSGVAADADFYITLGHMTLVSSLY